VSLNQGLDDLVAVALVAALAPLMVAVLPGPRVPPVVVFLLGGVLIGPYVLGPAGTSVIQLLANIGLGFLFWLAGHELDPALLRQRPGPWMICTVSKEVAILSQNKARGSPPMLTPDRMQVEDSRAVGGRPHSESGS
jgi:Kef-type K+ transport system membrane component KefB